MMELPVHRTPHFGPFVRDGRVVFRFWAPKQRSVRLQFDGTTLPMQSHGGWHSLETTAGFGCRYCFVLENGQAVPDPASRFQPADVHGPSELVDPAAYRWRNTAWRGRPWHETVLYELHVGTFTPEGTFASAARRLEDLAELGVTAIQLMPVADFPGRRNWGYDGVLPFAPDAAYGRPEDLKGFIDTAHGLGLSVMLDVVYNHYGSEGNYQPLYAPVFTERHETPWGAAVNYDDEGSAEVRAFVIENVLYWLEEFRFDGLRFDAVHEIRDSSEFHLLDEIRTAVSTVAADRPIHLVLENEENSAGWLTRREGEAVGFTAQWNDDMHHVLHVAVTGENSAYYGDYTNRPRLLGRALAEGFAFQGERMPYRGRPRGEASAHLPPDSFIAFLQNHDQVGNRATGDRIHHNHPLAAVRAAAAIYLLAPQIPMLFQGEEWAASTPFTFFCDVDAELAEKVREGRRNEFSRFPEYAKPEARATIPDPGSEQTFQSAKLRWREREDAPHADMLAWYRRILAVRVSKIVPLIPDFVQGGRYKVGEQGVVEVRWEGESGTVLTVALNLSATPRLLDEVVEGRPVWIEGHKVGAALAPWTVVWTLRP
ncbi:malto-oligosyltrehalose trehalohydrolase [Labrys miyagiensis]|uniref:Malto-oligosyltrehalose trehalohydrolase n=1 Tax=Labrys miyagiensis TaxID=346912 RepID=A0ABQ6CJG9_9HYPH|nr:malto-oligosyltrehalose trehalohydrolase [Labrys miyagiensis]GLS19777.1 malto-oligosyltrehalose trehalohydrolase [Labrys miyagiensis]